MASAEPVSLTLEPGGVGLSFDPASLAVGEDDGGPARSPWSVEGAIDWSRGAAEIERAVRAFTPWPSAYTTLHGRLLKVHRAAVASRPAPAPAGTVVRATGGDLEVATGEGRLRLLELQLEGKRRLTVRDFLAGQPLREGDKLG